MPREFKTIICPTDFSEASYRALEYALRFARLSNGTLVIPHILHEPISNEFQFEDQEVAVPFEDVSKQAADNLEVLRQEKLESYPHCVLLVEEGDPTSEILNIAQRYKADMIVIATHGRSGIQHLLMGSVAEKIIRHAPCPAFVVRRGLD